MGLDLSTLDISSASESGAVMQVTHPVSGAVLTFGDGKPVSLTLAGADSERFRRAQRAATNRKLRANQAGRRVQLSAEELENDALEMIVAATIGWQGISIGADGDLPFTIDNARAIYKKLPWLREQADAFISDRANFLKASPSD